MISKPELLVMVLTVAGLAWFVWGYIAEDLPEDFLEQWAEERRKAREARKNQKRK